MFFLLSLKDNYLKMMTFYVYNVCIIKIYDSAAQGMDLGGVNKISLLQSFYIFYIVVLRGYDNLKIYIYP